MEKAGFPLNIRNIVQSILTLSTTQVRDGEGDVFGSLYGVRQGCPLSAALYVLVYDPILRRLEIAGISFVAYVDDITIVVVGEQELMIALKKLQQFAADSGLTLNPVKTEILRLGKSESPLPLFSLPTAVPPTDPVTYDLDSLHPLTSPPVPPSQAPILEPEPKHAKIVHNALHLGHPLPGLQTPTAVYKLVAAEVEDALHCLNQIPLPGMIRIQASRVLLTPKILYRLECTPPVDKYLNQIQNRVIDFVVSAGDIPQRVTKKSLFSHKKHGFGLPHLPTLVPSRCLDNVHKYVSSNPQTRHGNQFSLSPSSTYKAAATLLGASTPLSDPYAGFFPPAPPPTGEFVPEIGLHVTRLTTHLKFRSAYSDGSTTLERGICGFAAVSPTGEVVYGRVPGTPNNYKAELIGIVASSYLSPIGATIMVDNKGAVSMLNNSKVPVTEPYWVNKARECILRKGQRVQWVKAHAGIMGNETADKYAKLGQTEPPQLSQIPTSQWDVCFKKENHQPPHKTWTKSLIPTHSHSDIHQISWTPVTRSFSPLPWLKWLLGLRNCNGFMSNETFWPEQNKKEGMCPTCQTKHNLSVHGFLSYCSALHPLVKHWLDAWGAYTPLATTWRNARNERDSHLTGKLCIPISLHDFLVAQVGKRVARSAIRSFQTKVISPLHESLYANMTPYPPSGKRSIWNPEGWDEERPLKKIRHG
jgi:ribonuclease HI